MCPQNPNILELISLLNPLISEAAIIITEILNAMAKMAIRIINLEKDLLPVDATFLVKKYSKFKISYLLFINLVIHCPLKPFYDFHQITSLKSHANYKLHGRNTKKNDFLSNIVAFIHLYS